MSNSHRTQASSSDATFREAGIGELTKDVLRIGSAPTPSREAFVTVVNLALVAAAVLVFQPEAPVAIALAAWCSPRSAGSSGPPGGADDEPPKHMSDHLSDGRRRVVDAARLNG